MTLSIVAAVALMCLALLMLILIRRRWSQAIQQAGFSLIEEAPEEVRSVAAGMLAGRRILFAYSNEESKGPPAWLLEVESHGTEDSNFCLLLYPLPEGPEGQALLASSGSDWVPDVLRRLGSGLWSRLEPAGQDLQEAIAGSGWLLYADASGSSAAGVVDGLARVARTVPPGAVVAIAALRGFLGVWTAGRMRPLLAAGPSARAAFGAKEA